MRKRLEMGGPEMDALRKRLEAEEKDHQDPENLGPFLACLSTEEAGHVSGSVFVVSAGGRIALYSDASISTADRLVAVLATRLKRGRRETGSEC